ncbi:MAG: phosphoadenosine phosphosulfate reductase family protein [Sulfolobales archaeon]
MRFKWPLQLKLKWCPNCNVPLIQEECDICGSKGFEVNLSPPGDVRPAFKGDINIIKEALMNEFADQSLINQLNMERNLVLLNKVPHYDDMKEVLIGGVVAGRYFFDPIKMKWRWRLSKYSAGVALSKGLVNTVTVDRIKPLEIIRITDDEEDTQYVVVNNDLEPIGIAVARNGRVRVQTIFSKTPVPEINKKTSTLEDFSKANDFRLRTLTSRGIKRVYVMNSKVKLPIALSYSGGKDSLVALDLTVRAGLEPAIIFNNTGLELPETVANVVHIVNHYGLEYHEARPDKGFWDVLNVFGPPAKDFRWCCKLIKLIPLAKLYKTLYPNGALNIVGQRGMESVDRARSGNVWRNMWIPHILNITPIQEWPQLAVWSYILNNKLPYNPLYECGFDRLGCYLCPAANVAEHHVLSKTHPEMWNLWITHLTEWGRKSELPEAWVKYALWRWLNPKSSGRRRVEIKCLGKQHLSNWVEEYEARLRMKILSKEITATKAKVIFNIPLPYKGLAAQAGLLGRVNVKTEDSVIEIKSPDYVIKASGSTVELIVNNFSKTNALELMINVIKLMVRWVKCVNCGACSLWCPTKAVELIDNKPQIKNDKCINCGICLEVCPISEVLINKVLIPFLTDNVNTPIMRRRAKSVTLSRSLRLNQINQNKIFDGNEETNIPDYFFK